MGSHWKNRYSFRLKKEDIELFEFLETVPVSKRSEVIRHLLRFGYLCMTERKRENEQIQRLMAEIKHLKASQEKQYEEILGLLTNGITLNTGELKDSEEKAITDEALVESAEAFLKSFNMNF